MIRLMLLGCLAVEQEVFEGQSQALSSIGEFSSKDCKLCHQEDTPICKTACCGSPGLLAGCFTQSMARVRGHTVSVNRQQVALTQPLGEGSFSCRPLSRCFRQRTDGVIHSNGQSKGFSDRSLHRIGLKLAICSISFAHD